MTEPLAGPAVRADFSSHFLDAVRDAHREQPLDLVLTYVGDSHFEPGAIDQVRELVAPVAGAHQPADPFDDL